MKVTIRNKKDGILSWGDKSHLPNYVNSKSLPQLRLAFTLKISRKSHASAIVDLIEYRRTHFIVKEHECSQDHAFSAEA